MNKYNIKKLYCVSQVKLDDIILEPRVPNNFMTKNKFEDYITRRVCFSKTIDGCLSALSMNLDNKKLYVYILDNISKHDIYEPSIEEVPDCKITHEVWCLDPCTVIYYKTILVTGSYDKEYKYIYGNGKIASLYRWKYEVI